MTAWNFWLKVGQWVSEKFGIHIRAVTRLTHPLSHPPTFSCASSASVRIA